MKRSLGKIILEGFLTLLNMAKGIKVRCEMTEYGSLLYRLEKRDDYVARAYLSPYPGCCGIKILTGVETFYDQNSGYCQTLLNHILDQKHDCGQIQATTNGHSPAMDHILIKFGFQVINTFVNPNTHNTITVYALNINQNEQL